MPSEGEKCPFSHKNIDKTLRELRPLVRREAHYIYRPPFIDDDDLVQEALAHIYAKRHQFDAKKSSYKTWALTVARNKLYNIAAYNLRQSRCPMMSNGKAVMELSWDSLEMEPCNPFSCPQPAQTIEYLDLVEIVAKKLSPTARRVFKALAEPTADLCQVSREDWISSLRKKKVGDIERAPKNVRLNSSHVAQHLGLTYSMVAKARRKITNEVRMSCHAL